MREILKKIPDNGKTALNPASQKEAGYDDDNQTHSIQHHPGSEAEISGSTSGEMLFVDPASEEFYY